MATQRKIVINNFKIDLNDYKNNSYYKKCPSLFLWFSEHLNGVCTMSIGHILNKDCNRGIRDDIMHLTSYGLINSTNINEHIYWIINDLCEFPICATPGCNIRLDSSYFLGFTKGYRKHCCNRCAQLDPITTYTKHKTTKERYGDPNFRNPEKNKMTCLKNYGVDNPMKSAELKKQRIQRNLERYGVEWYIQTEDFKRKSILTLLDHYNEDIVNPFLSTKVKQLIKDVMLDRYGVDNPTKILTYVDE